MAHFMLHERDTNKFEDRYQRRITKIDGSNRKLPTEPEAVPMAASGANPLISMIGTENSGPPAPEIPDPNPETAPMATSVNMLSLDPSTRLLLIRASPGNRT